MRRTAFAAALCCFAAGSARAQGWLPPPTLPDLHAAYCARFDADAYTALEAFENTPGGDPSLSASAEALRADLHRDHDRLAAYLAVRMPKFDVLPFGIAVKRADADTADLAQAAADQDWARMERIRKSLPDCKDLSWLPF